jgi:hypothetical protein
MMDIKTVTAETLGMGAAIERLNDGFESALNNIADPNSHAEAVREIKLTIKIKPIKDRSSCEYQVHLNTKLAGPKPLTGILFVGKQKGRMAAFEDNPDQMGIFSPDQLTVKEKEND